MYVHFTVDQNPLYDQMTGDKAFGIRKDPARLRLQPMPETVWGIPLSRSLPATCRDFVTTEFPRCVDLHLKNNALDREEANLLLANMLLRVVRAQQPLTPNEESRTPEQRIELAEIYADQNLHLGEGVAGMAAAAGLSRSYFSSLYRKVRGETAQDFLKALRLRRAQEFLRATDRRVADIARAVGYPECVAFTRMFRNQTGQSPTQWRRNAPL